MLIIALVLAVIGLAALVFAIVTSNALVAWVCIGASVLGVLLLTVDALRERRRRAIGVAETEHPDVLDSVEVAAGEEAAAAEEPMEYPDAEYPDDEYPDDIPDAPDAEAAAPAEPATPGRDD